MLHPSCKTRREGSELLELRSVKSLTDDVRIRPALPKYVDRAQYLASIFCLEFPYNIACHRGYVKSIFFPAQGIFACLHLNTDQQEISAKFILTASFYVSVPQI